MRMLSSWRADRIKCVSSHNALSPLPHSISISPRQLYQHLRTSTPLPRFQWSDLMFIFVLFLSVVSRTIIRNIHNIWEHKEIQFHWFPFIAGMSLTYPPPYFYMKIYRAHATKRRNCPAANPRDQHHALSLHSLFLKTSYITLLLLGVCPPALATQYYI